MITARTMTPIRVAIHRAHSALSMALIHASTDNIPVATFYLDDAIRQIDIAHRYMTHQEDPDREETTAITAASPCPPSAEPPRSQDTDTR